MAWDGGGIMLDKIIDKINCKFITFDFMNEKSKKGGRRPGAGRKPTNNPKIGVTFYVAESKIKEFGGLANLKFSVETFIETEGKMPLPKDYVFPTKIGVLNPDGTTEEIGKILRKTTKEQFETEYMQDPESVVRTNEDIWAEIRAIMAEKVPEARNTPNGKRFWQFEQDKRIKELKAKLK